MQVHVSRQFLGWIISLGEGVKIISPDEVVEQMKEEIEAVAATVYNSQNMRNR